MPVDTNSGSGASKVVLAAFDYIAHGWPVFPCNPLDKRPLTKHGFKDATLDNNLVRAWWQQWPNAMIGIPMGARTGAFCVDLDKKEGGIDGVATWLSIMHIHGGLTPNTRMHTTPSTGQHMLFMFVEGIRNIPLNKLAPGIEIKGEGGYIIVPPSVMADGRTYQSNGQMVSEAPEWLIKRIFGYLEQFDFEKEIADDAGKGISKEAEDSFVGYGPPTIDEIREALKQIPSDDYHIWFRVAGAIRRILDEDGYSVFEEWSKSSKKFNIKDCRRKWKDANDIRHITEKTIFYLAYEFNPSWRPTSRSRIHDRDQETKIIDEKLIVLTNLEFVATYKPPSYIITGLLQKRFVYSLTGMTGSGKTCIALRIAAHVITGKMINGHEVKKGKVLYFAGENPDDVLVRWIKLCEEMEIPLDTKMMHWLPGVPPLKNAEIRKKIYAASRKYGPFAMVIIDTSAAYFQGDDENSNVQLGEHARLMRRFIQLPGNPVVLVTCHPTKHPDLTNLLPRGGGAFLNEIDGNLSCVRDNQLIEIDTHGKFRGPEFAPLMFKLVPIQLKDLKDEDYRPIWSVMAVPISDEEHTNMQDSMENRRNELINIMTSKPGLSLAELANELDWKSNDGNPNRRLVQRIMDKLVFDKCAEKKGGHYSLTKKGMNEAASSSTGSRAKPAKQQEDLL